jgi:hypothetical protein
MNLLHCAFQNHKSLQLRQIKMTDPAEQKQVIIETIWITR